MSSPSEWLQGACRCDACQEDMTPQLGDLEYRLVDMIVIVEDVPMRVCEPCGKRVVPGPVAINIDDLVQDYVTDERASLMDRMTLHYRDQTQGEPERMVAFA